MVDVFLIPDIYSNKYYKVLLEAHIYIYRCVIFIVNYFFRLLLNYIIVLNCSLLIINFNKLEIII